MNLTALAVKLNDDANELRALARLVQTPRFRALYDSADNKSQSEAIGYFLSHNHSAIKDWIERERNRNIETATVDHLRNLARQYGLTNYQTLQREELIERIKDVRRGFRSSQTGLASTSESITHGND